MTALYSALAFYCANQAPEIKIGHVLDIAAPALASVIAFQEKINEMRESEPLFNIQNYHMIFGALWLLTGLGNLEIGNLLSAVNFSIVGLYWLAFGLFLPPARPRI